MAIILTVDQAKLKSPDKNPSTIANNLATFNVNFDLDFVASTPSDFF